jgi:hypothetical protein
MADLGLGRPQSQCELRRDACSCAHSRETRVRHGALQTATCRHRRQRARQAMRTKSFLNLLKYDSRVFGSALIANARSGRRVKANPKSTTCWPIWVWEVGAHCLIVCACNMHVLHVLPDTTAAAPAAKAPAAARGGLSSGPGRAGVSSGPGRAGMSSGPGRARGMSSGPGAHAVRVCVRVI